jgi:hypothetical protein
MATKIFLTPKSKLRTRRSMDELLAMLAYLYVHRDKPLAGGSDPNGLSYGNNIKNHHRLSQFYKDGHDAQVREALKVVDDVWRTAIAAKVDVSGKQKEAHVSEMCGVWLTILSLINNDFVIKKPEALWKYYKKADLRRLKAYSISVEQKQEWREASKEEKKKLLNPRTNDWDENSREVWPTANLNWRRKIINEDLLRDCVDLYNDGIIDKKRTKACTAANKTKMYCEGIYAPNVADDDMVTEGAVHTDHYIRHADGGGDDESNFWLVLRSDNLRRGQRDWSEYFMTEHGIDLPAYLTQAGLTWLPDSEAPKPDMIASKEDMLILDCETLPGSPQQEAMMG